MFDVLKGNIECTNIVLPEYISGRGWGYSNNHQESVDITLKDGTRATRGSFFYDNSVYISWKFTILAPTLYKEYDGLYAFANYFKARPKSLSLEDVYNVIEDLAFSH